MEPSPDKATSSKDNVSLADNKRKADQKTEPPDSFRKKQAKHWGPFTNEQAREAIQDLSYDVEFLKPKLVQRTSILKKDGIHKEEVRHSLEDTNHRVDRLCEAVNEVRELLSLERIDYSPETPASEKDYVE